MASGKWTRRDMLLATGLLSIGAGLMGALGLGGLLLRNRDDGASTDEVSVVVVTSDAQSIQDMPPIVLRAEWGALPPDHNARGETGYYSALNPGGWRVYDVPLAQIYTTVVVHHSVVEAGTDLATLLDIQRLHREDRRWADVAYHYFVGKDGTLYEGRDVHVRGAHVEGANTGSLGVCLLGNYAVDEPPAAQIQGATTLMRWLTDTLQLTHIATHRDFNPVTECPGDNLAAYTTQFAAATGLSIGTEGYIPPSA
jgi:hypothetical protein